MDVSDAAVGLGAEDENPADGGRGDLRIADGVLFGADAQVAAWVAARIEGMTVGPTARALGVVHGDDLVAGVVYDRFNGIHCEVSIAANPGMAWASRRVLGHLFGYPFNQLGLVAISAVVPATNLVSLNLATKLGFAPEALVRFAAPDGGALVILKMLRGQCRWIDHG